MKCQGCERECPHEIYEIAGDGAALCEACVRRGAGAYVGRVWLVRWVPDAREAVIAEGEQHGDD